MDPRCIGQQIRTLQQLDADRSEPRQRRRPHDDPQVPGDGSFRHDGDPDTCLHRPLN